jgi:hypothetical protein
MPTKRSRRHDDDAKPSPGIDPTTPSIARVYDYALGGKDNYEADREILKRVLAIDPHLLTLAREHRAWSRRVIKWLAGHRAESGGAGIDQFLDCGSGLPTMDNTHEVAQQANPDAKVVYVDNDPAVIVHGRALLEANDNTCFLDADLTRPAELLGDPRVAAFIDLDRPAGLIQCATIHHIDKLADQQAVMTGYIDRLAPGSYIALTHVHDPADGSEVSRLAQATEAAYRSTNATTHWRPRTEIETLFNGLEMVEPGLVPLHQWWPAGPLLQELPPAYHIVLGGVGRKP